MAPRLAEIPGMVPSLREEILGCAFAPRCPFVTERCRRVLAPHKVPATIRIVPALEVSASGKLVRPLA